MSYPDCQVALMSIPSPVPPPVARLLQSLQLGTPRADDGIAPWPVLGPACPEPACLTLADVHGGGDFRVTEVSNGGTVGHLALFNSRGRRAPSQLPPLHRRHRFPQGE